MGNRTNDAAILKNLVEKSPRTKKILVITINLNNYGNNHHRCSKKQMVLEELGISSLQTNTENSNYLTNHISRY
jgi:hypothetical protein